MDKLAAFSDCKCSGIILCHGQYCITKARDLLASLVALLTPWPTGAARGDDLSARRILEIEADIWAGIIKTIGGSEQPRLRLRLRSKIKKMAAGSSVPTW